MFSSNRKAVFAEDKEEEDDDDDEVGSEEALRSAGVRYVFPKGCKGIDVQIDNSSRLRSFGATLRNFAISPRLPVHLPNRTDTGDKYTYYKPSSNSYPGPSHIYAPSNQVLNTYLPPGNSFATSLETPSNSPSNKPTFSPFIVPTNINVPPKETLISCSSQCCDDSKGKLVIPILLKNRNSRDCCSRTAQLILPLKNIDITVVAQLRKNLSQKEFDADQLIQSILENLL